MSPVRKPSALKTAAARPAKDTLRETAKPQPQLERKARVTLNLPPELYRELTRWTGTAAETLDVPRVGVQEALRAMVSVIATGQARNAEQMVLAAIRDELNSTD
jgi:hypothetical protein